ncbi:YceI family protein [Hanstruepera flava]|uniref:YceI family protein n=1 Tax=Hanstruepera flava TaxID=2930218 RepID=UPI002027732E|nr:YceI family protein [Hanstruepera flava]
MKKIWILAVFLMSYMVNGQDKFLTKSGSLVFEASVPSFEEVKAKNESTTAILNLENGEIAALALVKGFRFKNALMEEHFNENYAESELFPKATFKGVIKNFSEIDIDDAEKSKIHIEGVLEFHGQEKKILIKDSSISKDEDVILVQGEFYVQASDFKIEIPKIVSNKLSNDVLVSFTFNLTKK